ncbi:MAG: Asp-tRNA(Asn)/Glu-tRNA(Gln) amidotransferase subunit GatB [Patescibacteria group bacterium]
MSEYVPTIGLEIHAELKTKTKMFCCSKNDADAAGPNVNICPVCLAHPGTLPVINKEAVRHVLRVGIALKAKLADYTEFDRKNYFYPDLPKGYQLSQYEYPLVSGGELNGVAITRVHLEEDTASSIHEEGIGTTIDYNRAGVPLMELVTEPVITSAKQAGDFARELQLLLKYLDVSNANMEKGEMRVEANISVSKNGGRGTKVEIKNLNSFRAMERAVECEIDRQVRLLESGSVVVQETRGWDEKKQSTFPQRIKEGSADYRYFPDPDLPSLRLSELEEYRSEYLSKTMPEIPSERRARYLAIGVKLQDADSFVRDQKLGDFFEEVISGHENSAPWVSLASNYVSNDLVFIIRDTAKPDTELRAEISISARNFGKIIDMLSSRKISSRAAKDILTACVSTGKDPVEIAEEGNLLQTNAAGGLEAIVRATLSANPSVVADYKAGKIAALQYLIGQSMRVTKGAMDPSALRELTIKLLQDA